MDATQKPITDEIAGVEKDIFRDYFGKIQANPDKVLKSESGGKGIELYEDLLRDDKVGSTLQTRKLAVTGKEWEVVPASEDSEDIKIAEFVKEVLVGFNYDASRRVLLSGIVTGFKPAEIMWEYSEGDVWVKDIIGRSPRRFVFDLKNNMRLLTFGNMIEGEELPDKKFIVFRNISDNGSPYGDALGRLLYWPVWFKKNAIKFWMIFTDKFGSPTAIGKYPSGTLKPQQDELLAAIEAIQQESAIKIPDNMIIELLEATRAGSVNTHESLCNFMNSSIISVMLGHTGTSQSTPGKLGSEDAAIKVKDEYTKADADELCECQNNTLIRWIVDYNFPKNRQSSIVNRQYPKVWIRTDEEKDLKPLAERDEIISRMVEIPKKYIYDTYGIPQPEEGEEVVTVGSRQPQVPGLNGQAFSENPPVSPFIKGGIKRGFTPEQQVIEELNAKVISQGAEAFILNEDTIIKAVESSESYEEAIQKILELYPQMDMDRLTAILERSILSAGLYGKYNAGNNT